MFTPGQGGLGGLGGNVPKRRASSFSNKDPFIEVQAWRHGAAIRFQAYGSDRGPATSREPA
jgi:hypothetical protein